MERKQSRLGSALSTRNGWNPLLLAAVLAVGLVLGLGLGLRELILGGKASPEESYFVLASKLYAADPSTAPVLRGRLVSLGYSNPSVELLMHSERYAASDDGVKQREAVDLRALAQAFLVGAEQSVAGSPTAAVTSTVPMTATATSIAEPTQQAEPTATQPEATPVPTQAATVPSEGSATSTDGQPVRMRSEPNTQSDILVLISVGEKLQILDLVEGEAIDPAEPRWYKVKYAEFEGYTYFKLVATE